MDGEVVMSPLYLIIVGLLYIATAVDLYMHGKGGLASAFLFYALANFGLLWEVMK
jgi:hypothetical protein